MPTFLKFYSVVLIASVAIKCQTWKQNIDMFSSFPAPTLVFHIQGGGWLWIGPREELLLLPEEPWK